MANFVLIFLNWQQKAHTLGKILQQVWFWRTWSTWSLWMCGLGEQVWEWLGLESSPLRLRPLLHFQVHAPAVPRCTLSTLDTLLMWPLGCSQPPAISTFNLTSTGFPWSAFWPPWRPIFSSCDPTKSDYLNLLGSEFQVMWYKRPYIVWQQVFVKVKKGWVYHLPFFVK